MYIEHIEGSFNYFTKELCEVLDEIQKIQKSAEGREFYGDIVDIKYSSQKDKDGDILFSALVMYKHIY